MKKIDWREPHIYEPEGAIDPVQREVLCHCGLPEDSGLHIKPLTHPQGELRSKIERALVNKHHHIRIGDECTCSWSVEEIVAETLAAVKAVIPKEKGFSEISKAAKEDGERGLGKIDGYNQALRDLRKTFI